MLKMKHWSKNLMKAIGIFALSLSLAACGGTSGGSGSPSSKTDTAKEAQASQESDTAAAQTTEQAVAQTESPPAEEMRWLCVKVEDYDSEGELYDLIETTYNEYGNMVTRNTTRRGNLIFQDTYEYTPDQILSSSHRIVNEKLANCVKTGESTSSYNSYGFLESKHELMATTYNEGESGSDYSGEYDYTYFFDAAGTTQGYISRQQGDSSLSLTIYGYSTDEYEEVWENDLLVQKSDDAVIYDYEYDNYGNLIKETATYAIGTEHEHSDVIIYTYKKQLCKNVPSPVLPEGDTMEVIGEAVSKDTEGNELYSYRYVYDEYGRQVGACGYTTKGMSFGEEYNEYDENGRIIRVWTSDFVTDMTYDAQGNRIQEDFRETADGEIVLSATCEYDAEGNLTMTTQHALSDEYADIDGRRQEYEYKDGQVLISRLVDSEGTVLSYEEYTYDADGRVAAITAFNGDGTIEAITEPVYTNIHIFK